MLLAQDLLDLAKLGVDHAMMGDPVHVLLGEARRGLEH